MFINNFYELMLFFDNINLHALEIRYSSFCRLHARGDKIDKET